MGSVWHLARRPLGLLLTLALAVSLVAACGDDDGGEQLKLGFLVDFTGGLAEYGESAQTGIDLAILHINAAGGVNGQDVVYVTGDTRVDPTQATEEARRLVDVEGVHAIVGPLSSTATLAVAESVTGPGGVPQISPSATSPALTTVDDDGYLFRTTISDAAQGVVLAQLAAEEGYDNVGVIHRDDAYGQGLAEAFAAAFGGRSTLAAYPDAGQASYLSELQAAAANGADVLLAIGFAETEIFVREALEQGLFSAFLFCDGNKSQDLIDQLGAENLEGFKGTAPGSDPEAPSTMAWNAAYVAEYGAPPALPFVRETYDAVVALALAAEAAGSTGGAAIRDRLPAVAGPPGRAFLPGPGGVRAALAAVRAGEDANYEGAATPLDWNADGEVADALVEIWEFRGGRIVTLELRPVTLR